MSLLLAIDVGNTNITLGAFRDKSLIHTWRLRTHSEYTADELGIQLLDLLHYATLDLDLLTGIIIASVVPPLDTPLIEACTKYLHRVPLMVGPGVKLGITNLYKNPQEVGADRLVNAVAVHALLKGAVIVVDFGTATTFDCVSAKGEYLGGVIAPGLEIANDALASRTAKLPRVTFQIPSQVLGKTTKESLQSGLFWGYIGQVEGVLQQLMKEMRQRPAGSSARLAAGWRRPKVVATGGLAPVIGPRIKAINRILPDLTLEGLRIIWELNR